MGAEWLSIVSDIGLESSSRMPFSISWKSRYELENLKVDVLSLIGSTRCNIWTARSKEVRWRRREKDFSRKMYVEGGSTGRKIRVWDCG
jgi:hypothetical protein